MTLIREFLETLDLPSGDLTALPSSAKHFPDGAQFRIEIPSVEGPRCLQAVLEEAERLDVVVHRVSQGSGVMMLSDAELSEMAATAAAAGVEVSLFARPSALWDVSATARSPAGAAAASVARGQEQVVAQLEDIARAADRGFRSVLVSDIGVLLIFDRMREAGLLPQDMQAKVSVMLPASNPSTAQLLVSLGASTINLPVDLELAQIAAIRSVISVPLDIYVEAPDTLGGFVRSHLIPEFIRVAAPVYLKFGLRNAPDIYPSGGHLEQIAVALVRERVRSARLGMELLGRSGLTFETSARGAADLAVPVVP